MLKLNTLFSLIALLVMSVAFSSAINAEEKAEYKEKHEKKHKAQHPKYVYGTLLSIDVDGGTLSIAPKAKKKSAESDAPKEQSFKISAEAPVYLWRSKEEGGMAESSLGELKEGMNIKVFYKEGMAVKIFIKPEGHKKKHHKKEHKGEYKKEEAK